MPVIAQSPPLPFGGGTRTQTPRPTKTPKPRTPKPVTPAPVITPTIEPTAAPGSQEFVEKHQQFISTIEQIGSCFKREDLPSFTDQEFADHISVAAQDKYITQTKDTYCNLQGVSNLINALKRITEEKEIL